MIHCGSIWSCGREVECIGGLCWCGEERLSDWSPSSVGVNHKGKEDWIVLASSRSLMTDSPEIVCVDDLLVLSNLLLHMNLLFSLD